MKPDELLIYNPETGIFRWKFTGNGRKRGGIAGSMDAQGYMVIRINGKIYRSGRLAWYFVYGSWPINQIDHINRIKSDDRLANLRDVTSSENNYNRIYRGKHVYSRKRRTSP